jgi:hypothetical protein
VIKTRRLNWYLVGTLFCFTALSSIALAAGGRPLTAVLSAANETGDIASDATGTSRVELNQGLGTVCWEITGTNLEATVTAAHIHEAPAGADGAVVLGFFGPPTSTPAPSSLPADGCVENVSQSLIKRIRQNPRGFYVNVHTTAFPGGEMRGQLSK